MGMLQLAGIVSGGGKAMQQSAANLQTTMSQRMLMEEREKMEQARMRLTFAHDEGMLQKRQAFDVQQADAAHSRNLDLRDQEHDFQAGQNRISRDADRRKMEKEAELRKDLESTRYQNEINKLVVEQGYSQQAAAQKVKEEMEKEKRLEKRDRDKEERDRREKERERQHLTGERITLKSMELQGAEARGRSGATKEDHHDQDAKVKAIENALKLRMDELNSISLTEKREAQIRREIQDLEQERNALLGIKGGYRERPPIRMPQ